MKKLILFLLLLLAFHQKSQAQNIAPSGRLDHVYAGAAIATATYFIAEKICTISDLDHKKKFARKWSILAVAGAALGKELFDAYVHTKDHTYDQAYLVDSFGDFATTCVTGMSFTVVISF